MTTFHTLEDVISDESFPEVDLALRRGRHVHKGDERWYDFLLDARALLEPFYQRYGTSLEQRSDGYFFLVPHTDALGKRSMGVAEMIVGQGLALCLLDPRSVETGGVITREELLNQLASVMGTDALMRTLNPTRKRIDERVMQRTVRQKVNQAVARLGQLGFVQALEGDQLKLWPSLMRFAEPVRGLDAPSEALKKLIERGEASLTPDPTGADSDAAADADTATDADAAADADAADTHTAADAAAADPETGTDAEAAADAEAAFEAARGGAADEGVVSPAADAGAAAPDFDLDQWDELFDSPPPEET